MTHPLPRLVCLIPAHGLSVLTSRALDEDDPGLPAVQTSTLNDYTACTLPTFNVRRPRCTMDVTSVLDHMRFELLSYNGNCTSLDSGMPLYEGSRGTARSLGRFRYCVFCLPSEFVSLFAGILSVTNPPYKSTRVREKT